MHTVVVKAVPDIYRIIFIILVHDIAFIEFLCEGGFSDHHQRAAG